jgi:hypothetical protein
VVLLSQLRRPANVNDPPTMIDMKESGDIEAHVHMVLLLHCPLANDGGTRGTGSNHHREKSERVARIASGFLPQAKSAIRYAGEQRTLTCNRPSPLRRAVSQFAKLAITWESARAKSGR